MKKPGKFLRAIPPKHPVILNIFFTQKEPMYAQIGMQKLKERAKIIKDNPKFLENCSKALLEIAEEKELSKKIKTTKLLKILTINYIWGFS